MKKIRIAQKGRKKTKKKSLRNMKKEALEIDQIVKTALTQETGYKKYLLQQMINKDRRDF